jgi:hypothetical protein
VASGPVGDLDLVAGWIKVDLEDEADGPTWGTFAGEAIGGDRNLFRWLEPKTIGGMSDGLHIFGRSITRHDSRLTRSWLERPVGNKAPRASSRP